MLLATDYAAVYLSVHCYAMNALSWTLIRVVAKVFPHL